MMGLQAIAGKYALKKMGKRSFAIWIIYQTVKGTLTTVFIWAPMIYYYFAQKFLYTVKGKVCALLHYRWPTDGGIVETCLLHFIAFVNVTQVNHDRLVK
jgi:hypothetical protein